jgi:L-lactate dehydrogenase complex protein LldG
MNREIVALFLENAVKAAAVARQVQDGKEMLAILRELLPAEAAVYCPALSPLEVTAAEVLPQRAGDYFTADITVEEVLAGIAETGSIVCASVEGRAVQASLVPPHHIALLRREKIHATLDDFFAAVGAAPPTNITLITGPSRTADIELTLAIGVHGPGRLDVLVV